MNVGLFVLFIVLFKRMPKRKADAQADLSLRWAHVPFCWFCHDAAHLFSFFSVCQLHVHVRVVCEIHITRKRVYRDFRPRKIQTILLSYRS